MMKSTVNNIRRFTRRFFAWVSDVTYEISLSPSERRRDEKVSRMIEEMLDPNNDSIVVPAPRAIRRAVKDEGQ